MSNVNKVKFKNIPWNMEPIPGEWKPNIIHIDWDNGNGYRVYWWDEKNEFYVADLPMQLKKAISNLVRESNNKLLGED